MPPAALAVGSLASAGLQAFGGSGGGSNESQQRSIDPFQAQLLDNARGRTDTAAQNLNSLSGQLSQQAQGNFNQIQSGQLDDASRSLLAQNVDRNRRLQAARKQALASRFGAGSTLAGILGAQQGLKSDLAANQDTFSAFRDQIDRAGAVNQGLAGVLGLQGQGFDALSKAHALQLQRAGLTSGVNAQTSPNQNFFDRLGQFGDVAGKVGAGFGSGGRS